MRIISHQQAFLGELSRFMRFVAGRGGF
jgi:hypothetical protein